MVIFLICDKNGLICADVFVRNQHISHDSNKVLSAFSVLQTAMRLLQFQQWAVEMYFVIVSNFLILRVSLFLFVIVLGSYALEIKVVRMCGTMTTAA